MQKFLFSILLLALATTAGAQTTAAANPAPATVKWYTIEEAQALNAKAPRKIFMDMYTDWCGWCKTMDKNTFSQPDVAEYLNTYFYPVKFNAEGRNPAVFRGQTYNFNPQYRSHDLAINIMQGRMSYPTTLYLDEELNLITVVPGYQSPEDLRPILVFFAQNYYQKMDWESFTRQWPEIVRAMHGK